MDRTATLILLGAGVALVALSVIGSAARTRAPLAWHAHLPWNGIAFAGMAGALLAIIHLGSGPVNSMPRHGPERPGTSE
jgi:hypothetical protein